MKGFFFMDVDTQRDFIVPGGALYVPGAERLLPKIKRIFDFALRHEVFVLSTADAHAPDDVEFRLFPPHCVAGTPGQRKMEETLFPRHLVLGNRPAETNLVDSVRQNSQIVVEKQALDVFTNPVMGRLLKILPGRAVVFGVTTEYCVKHAVLGLRQAGAKVVILTDAIGAVQPQSGHQALQEMQAAGAELSTVDALLGATSR